MGEVVVVVSVRAKAGRVGELERLLTTAVEQTHALDDGALLCALHRSVDDPARFVLIERFVSAEALEVHRELPYAQETFAAIPDLIDELSETVVEAIPAGDPAKGVIA
jgi:quinol monooxygenase YgiN